MASQFRGAPSFSFAVFLAMAAFGSYLWSSGPLETSRPPSLGESEYSLAENQRIPARLWQDPFRVVFERQGRNGVGQGSIPGFEQSGLGGVIARRCASDNLLILAVMVPTEARPEIEERRRRRRYAVVTALGESGYVPMDAEHIRAVRIGLHAKSKMMLPYEWFKHDANARSDAVTTLPLQRVLVLWLDAGRFAGQPFARMADLAGKILSAAGTNKKHIRFTLLGPAGSGTLRAMAIQARDYAQARKGLYQLGIAGFHIISPTATMADRELYRGLAAGERMDKLFAFSACNEKETCITFHRTIKSDDFLIASLVTELEKRSVHADGDHVVLISELDTEFGRALPQTFRAIFCGWENQCGKYLHNYGYLRGIDGIAPGTQDIGRSTSKASGAGGGDKFAKAGAPSDIRRPVGTGQFDYLRRLANEISELDQYWRKQDGKGITAIGILGSDVYDKLLILRALRPKLLGIHFFTTDLDAQLLHPAEFRWTRNLITASSFDLKLHPYWQGRIPPFRDSYQTSIFYSTRLALRLSVDQHADEDVAKVRMQLPLMFEIGRDGAVQLNPFSEDLYSDPVFAQSTPLRLHPPGEDRHLWVVWALVIFILALGILALQQMHPKAGYWIMWLSIALVVLAVISALAIWLDASEEPFALFSGISVWPSEIIRGMVLVLSLYFVCDALKSLKTNYYQLSDEYLCIEEQRNAAGDARRQCQETEFDGVDRVQLISWLPVLVFMMLLSAVLEGMLPLTISFGNAYYMLPIWIGVLLSWFLYVNKTLPDANNRNWVNLSPGGSALIPIQRYWHEYGMRGSMRLRFIRSFSVVLIFQAFASFIFTLFGMEPAPLRGEITAIVDRVIIVATMLSMFFLLFLLVDATRLCIVWMRGLVQHPYNWHGTRAHKMAEQMQIPWNCAAIWVELKLIAERSQEVSKLIYYPFIVIILLLFSRISYFDNWGFPQGLAIIIATIVLIAVYNALLLRRVAEKIRDDAIALLRQQRVALLAHGQGENQPSAAQLNQLIDNITDIKSGAFQPFLEQPVVKATLLLLGGIGITASQFSAVLY